MIELTTQFCEELYCHGPPQSERARITLYTLQAPVFLSGKKTHSDGRVGRHNRQNAKVPRLRCLGN
jgi:hypothetical protein